MAETSERGSWEGYNLGELDRRAEALAIYDDVMQRFGNADEPVLQAQVERARSAMEHNRAQ